MSLHLTQPTENVLLAYTNFSILLQKLTYGTAYNFEARRKL
jgi:hypothetical protein